MSNPHAFCHRLTTVLILVAVSMPMSFALVDDENADEKPDREIIELPEEVLTEYVGAYQVMPEMVMEITLEDGTLYATPTGQQKAELFAYDVDRFFLKLVPAEITFTRDNDGVVSSIIISQNGEDVVAPRKNE